MPNIITDLSKNNTFSDDRNFSIKLSVFKSIKAKARSKTIGWNDFIAMVENPSIGDKREAQLITPHNSTAKTGAAATKAEFSIVVIDYDNGAETFDKVFGYWQKQNVRAVMFTTSRHTIEEPRFKVVLKLGELLSGEEWHELASGLAILQSADPAQARVSQVFFAPNKLTDSSEYRYEVLEGDCFSRSRSLWNEAFAAFEQQRGEAEAKATPKPRKADPHASNIVGLINDAYDIRVTLKSSGLYERRGKKYLFKGSESGIPGVVLLKRDGKEVVYSHHSKTDPLSALNHKGHSLDCADVLCALEYDNDFKAMIRAEADKLDPEGQKKRQREYMRDKERTETVERLGDALTFGEAMTIVNSFNGETPPNVVKELLGRVSGSDPLEKDRLFKAIKSNTGTGTTRLWEMEKELNPTTVEVDHKAIAAEIVNKIGSDDLVADELCIWRWDKSGIWCAQTPETIRQWALEYMDEFRISANDFTVQSVAKLLHTRVYKPGIEFNNLTKLSSSDAFCCENGEVVLNAGCWVLEPHRRESYMTTRLPVSYDPDARAPRFEQFLNEVLPDDPESQTALLEMIGYSLMPHCRYERFILMIGEGSNGKSIIFRVLEMLLGKDNCAGVQPAQFGNEFYRAMLNNKLANVVTEIPVGVALDDSLKAIVSGEPIAVSHKYQPTFVMHPFATCWFGTNQFPQNRDFSDGIYRRALMLRFKQTFKPELGNCDPDLRNKLERELPGILNMALTAYGEAVKRGSLSRPQLSDDTLNEWALEADQVKAFVNDCARCDAGGKELLSVVYFQYEFWAAENGRKNLVNSSTLRQRLDRLGFSSKRTKKGWVVCDLSFREPPVPETPEQYF